MKKIPFLYLIFLFQFCLLQRGHSQKSKQDKPNVIFIYTDDEGRGMLGYEGQQIIKTPNVNMMPKNGISFQRDYGCMFCAPARASFLTGFADIRKNKFILNRAGIYINYLNGRLTLPEVDDHINAIEKDENPGIVMPQVFAKAGYVTGEIGKLEWGFATSRKQMKDHGWDYYYGYLDHRMCHGFYPEVMFENGNPINIPGNTRPESLWIVLPLSMVRCIRNLRKTFLWIRPQNSLLIIKKSLSFFISQLTCRMVRYRCPLFILILWTMIR
jgi:hypothetical protein